VHSQLSILEHGRLARQGGATSKELMGFGILDERLSLTQGHACSTGQALGPTAATGLQLSTDACLIWAEDATLGPAARLWGSGLNVLQPAEPCTSNPVATSNQALCGGTMNVARTEVRTRSFSWNRSPGNPCMHMLALGGLSRCCLLAANAPSQARPSSAHAVPKALRAPLPSLLSPGRLSTVPGTAVP
jgi:hypothetical protein